MAHTRAPQITRELIAALGKASDVAEPWLHLEFQALLPADILDEVRLFWPEQGWKQLVHPDQAIEGTQPPKYRRQQQEVTYFFPNLGMALTSFTFQEALATRLKLDGHAPLFPKALLIDDAPGYWIRPHPDTPIKKMTLQVYLPDDATTPDMGTRLLAREESRGADDRRLAFLPNAGYAFKIGPHTWHSVERCLHRRKSIQVIWYDSPQPAIAYV